MYGTNNYNIGIYTLACSSVESAWLVFCFLVYLALRGGGGFLALHGLKFTWTKISSLLGISRSTLYHRLKEEGINPTNTYSTVTDNDLDRITKYIKQAHSTDGKRLTPAGRK